MSDRNGKFEGCAFQHPHHGHPCGVGIFDALCIRADGHEPPCNGLPRETCPTLDKVADVPDTVELAATPLPCPFCGSRPDVLGRETPAWPQWKMIRMHCRTCETSGPHFALIAEAIAAWNKRAAPIDVQKVAEMIANSIWRWRCGDEYDSRTMPDVIAEELSRVLNERSPQ